MPPIPKKIIHAEDLPLDLRARHINWKALSPRAKNQAKKTLKDKRKIAKARTDEKLEEMKADRDTAITTAFTQSFAANHLEIVNLKLNQSNQNSEAQVKSLVKVIEKLQLDNADKDDKISRLEKRLETCSCEKAKNTGWMNTFNSNRRVEKQTPF